MKRSANLPIVLLGTAFAVTLAGCAQDAANCQRDSNSNSCRRSGSSGGGSGSGGSRGFYSGSGSSSSQVATTGRGIFGGGADFHFGGSG